MGKFTAVKNLVREYFAEIDSCPVEDTEKVLQKYMTDAYTWEGVFPFMYQSGIQAVADVFWKPVKTSLTALQRRQDVFMAGVGTDNKTWVVSMGQFVGLFDQELLNIRTTGKMQHLQYVEFTEVKDGKIQHTAMFVDLLGFMKEAGCYPLPPESGHYFVYPGPREHNGLMFEDAPEEEGIASFEASKNMMEYLDENMSSEPYTRTETMQKFWTDDMIWYGPCGIGASYTIPRYQIQDQMHFREGLTDSGMVEYHSWFGEGHFACYYAEMTATSRGGWLGMAAGGGPLEMRGDLDIYYIKDGKISENWCLIDLPHWLYQQGVNVFERTGTILNPKL